MHNKSQFSPWHHPTFVEQINFQNFLIVSTLLAQKGSSFHPNFILFYFLIICPFCHCLYLTLQNLSCSMTQSCKGKRNKSREKDEKKFKEKIFHTKNQKLQSKTLYVVENVSHYLCSCGNCTFIFKLGCGFSCFFCYLSHLLLVSPLPPLASLPKNTKVMN